MLVGGLPARSVARRVAAEEPISISGEGPRFVSRGGEKLAAAIDHFDVDVTDRSALDAGASTGGFTDCLLQAGVAHVVAVDVGRGQLAWSLRTDPRRDRPRADERPPPHAGRHRGRVDLCTADLSFISLTVCAPALARCVTADADLVLLVKPQFEDGRGDVGKGGVVRDAAVASIGAPPGARRPRCRGDRRGIGDAVTAAGRRRQRRILLPRPDGRRPIVGDDALDAAVDRAHTGARS